MKEKRGSDRGRLKARNKRETQRELKKQEKRRKRQINIGRKHQGRTKKNLYSGRNGIERKIR